MASLSLLPLQTALTLTLPFHYLSLVSYGPIGKTSHNSLIMQLAAGISFIMHWQIHF